jgi:transketolase
VLPSGCRARISIEAGATYGWHRWVGDVGEVIGLDRFGESAPWADIYEEFGFTPERVADQGKALVEKLA